MANEEEKSYKMLGLFWNKKYGDLNKVPANLPSQAEGVLTLKKEKASLFGKMKTPAGIFSARIRLKSLSEIYLEKEYETDQKEIFILKKDDSDFFANGWFGESADQFMILSIIPLS